MTPSTAYQLAQRYFRLKRSWLGEGGHPVDPDDAQRRAATCLACPRHDTSRPIYEALAGVEADHLRSIIELKNEMRLRVDGEKSLHLCGVCSCVLRTKVWVPIKHAVENTSVDDLPENCWIITESAP